MIVSIIIFVLVLSILILVHELGHFIVARKLGVWVEEFGLGYPPRLAGKKIGDTVYSINAIPIGGFNKLHGEIDEQGLTDPKRAFLYKSKKARALIIVSGVIMNFLLAVVCFAIVYSFSGISRESGKVMVVDVSSGSPAVTAGIVVGDQILSVDGKVVKKSDDVINLVTTLGGNHTLVVETGPASSRVQKKVVVGTAKDPQTGKYYMGIVLTSQEIYFPPVWQRPFYGIYDGFGDAVYYGKSIVLGLGGLVGGIFKGQAPQGVVGPLGIFALTTVEARNGFLTLIYFVGIISVNLAIVNLIPFPPLDGGRLLFIGIEAVIRRRVSHKVEITVDNVGMLILLILVVIITVGEVRKLILAGGLQGFINSLGK